METKVIETVGLGISASVDSLAAGSDVTVMSKYPWNRPTFNAKNVFQLTCNSVHQPLSVSISNLAI